jgi:hypothetical protein
MKILKLKYVALILTIASFTSCSKDYAIEEADKTAIENSDAFVFEDGINNYVIDGQLTYDRKQIGKEAKDAWNVHYDIPQNRVVISTTPESFEKYKNSNLEFKKALQDNDREAKKNSDEMMVNKALPTGAPASYIAPHANQHLIMFSYTKVTIDYNRKHFVSFIAGLDPDLSGRNAYEEIYYDGIGSSANNHILTPCRLVNINFSDLFTSGSSKPTMKAYIVNESQTSSLTKTFWKEISYAGQTITYTVSKNSQRIISGLQSFGPKSYN